MTVDQMCQEVTLELKELKKLGVRISSKTMQAASDKVIIEKYQDMSVSDCADLLILLYN